MNPGILLSRRDTVTPKLKDTTKSLMLAMNVVSKVITLRPVHSFMVYYSSDRKTLVLRQEHLNTNRETLTRQTRRPVLDGEFTV